MAPKKAQQKATATKAKPGKTSGSKKRPANSPAPTPRTPKTPRVAKTPKAKPLQSPTTKGGTKQSFFDATSWKSRWATADSLASSQTAKQVPKQQQAHDDQRFGCFDREAFTEFTGLFNRSGTTGAVADTTAAASAAVMAAVEMSCGISLEPCVVGADAGQCAQTITPDQTSDAIANVEEAVEVEVHQKSEDCIELNPQPSTNLEPVQLEETLVALADDELATPSATHADQTAASEVPGSCRTTAMDHDDGNRGARLNTLRETLFNWPETMIKKVAWMARTSADDGSVPADSYEREYAEFVGNMLASMSMTTSFSGIDSPSTALAMLGAGAVMLSGFEPSAENMPVPQNLWAVEWLKGSQAQLKKHPYGPCCIFTDINDLWLPSLADKLDTISREHKIMSVLKELVVSAVCTSRTAHCKVCNRSCALREGDVHVGGTPCTDFSARGDRDKLDGKTTSALLAFVAMRRDFQEPYWVQENVASFPDAFLRSTLQDLYEIQSCVVDPSMLGWPIARRRKYVVGRHLQKTSPWSMSLAAFISGLHCGPKCSTTDDAPAWDILFVASRHELRSELEWASKRPTSLAASCPPNLDSFDVEDFEKCLTNMEQGFLNGYESICTGVACSLAQNPQITATHSSRSTLHTLLKNAGVIWSQHHARWLTPNEALIAQGFPVYPVLSHGIPMTSFALEHMDGDGRGSSGSHNAEHVSRTSKIGMAGNAMHIECVASVLLFVITRGCMSLNQLRSAGLHKTLCKRFHPASFLSQNLCALARLVSGPST